jgi:hypothetical protein
MTTTALSLVDLSRATQAYLRDEVTVQIGRITGNVETDEEGTFTVRVTNADEPRGIRLHDVTVHLTVKRDSVLTLDPFVATLLETRATGDRSDPRLPTDETVGEMFVFFPQDSIGLEPTDVLEPGEVIEFEVTYHGEGAGTTDITAHIHAQFSVTDLFPRSNGSTVEASVTVLGGS